MARICGKQTADGTPCQRPAGCRIRHRRRRRRRAINRAPEIAAATIANELTLDDYATTTATDVLTPLKEERLLVETRGLEHVSVDRIIELLSDPELDGRTISPKLTNTGYFIEPAAGIAVALPGSDLRFEIDTETLSQHTAAHHQTTTDAHSPPENAPENVTALTTNIKAFLQHTRPVIDTGAAWIGLWKDDGVIELNVTVVVDETHKRKAKQMGRRWDQKSVYHLRRGKVLKTRGSGGKSIYSTRKSDTEPEPLLRSRLQQ